MAKRKKINQRILILLIVMGVLTVGGVTAFFISRMEEDVSTLITYAEKASKNGNHEEAAKRYAQAARRKGGKPEHWLLCARENLKLYEDGSLSVTKRREKRGAAVKALQNALRKDPKYLEAQELVCEMRWSARRWADFIEEANKLIKISPEDNPENHLYYYRRGSALAIQAERVRTGKVDEAIADLRKAIELKPDEISYHQRLIYVLGKFKSDEDVDKTYAYALTLVPDNAMLRSQYAIFLWSNDRKDEAIKQLEEARERQPDDAVSYVTWANILLRDPGEDNRAEALKILRKAKEIEPGNPVVHVSVFQILKGEKKTEEAIKELREGLAAIEKRLDELSSDEANVLTVRNIDRGKILLLYHLVDSLLDSMRDEGAKKGELLEEARKYLDELAAYGERPEKMVLEGRIIARDGQLEEAVKLLDEGRKRLAAGGKVSEYIDNSLELYTLYMVQGRPGKAESLLDEILAKYPSHIGVLVAKARLLVVNQRNYDKAEEYLLRALKVKKDHGPAIAILTEIHILRGTLDPRTIELTPGAIGSIINRAKQTMASGRVEQAISLLEDLHQRIPDNLKVTRELVGLYITRGMTEQAEKLVLAIIDSSGDPEVVVEFEYMRDMLREKDPEKKFQMMMARADKVENPVVRALHKANACKLFNKEDDYLKYLKEAAAAGPDNPKPAVLLFSYSLGKKNWDMAEEYLEIIKENNFDGTKGELSQANLEMARGEYDEAVDILNAMLAEHPQMKRVRVLLGQCYLETGRLEEAKEAFQVVVDNDPSFGGAIAVIGMAQVTDRMKDMSEHWKWVKQAQKIAPNNPYIRNQIVVLQEIEAKEEDLPALIERRKAAMARAPDNVDNRLRLASLYLRNGQTKEAGEIYAFLYENTEGKYKLIFAKLLAAVYLEMGRESDIDKLFADLLNKTDEKSEAYRLYGELLQRYDTARAEKVFEDAVDAAPDHYRPYLAQARFFRATGRLDDAIAALQKALKNRQDKDGKRSFKKELVTLMLTGDWQRYKGDVEKYVNSLLSDAPDDVSSLTLKAGFLFKQALVGDQEERERNLEKAAGTVTKAVQINRDYVPAHNQRSRIYLAMGNWASARADLQTAFDLCKMSDSVWATSGPVVGMELSALDERLGNFDAAISTCQNILSSYPDYSQATVSLIRLYMAQKNWDKAEKQISEAADKYPENWAFPLYEARMWQSREEIARAEEACARAYELSPKSPIVVSEYMTILLSLKKFQQVLDMSEKLLGQTGFSGWLDAMRARASVGLGNAADGEALFEDALKKALPANLPMVVAQIGLTYGAKDAAAKLAEWQSFRPSDARLHILLANLYREAGESEKTMEALEQALELSSTPGSKASVLVQLGRAYNVRGRIEKAKEAYLKYLEYNSQNAEVLNNLAYLYVDNLNDPKVALGYATKAIQILPNEPNVIDTYGWVLAKLEKHREAQEVFARGLRRKPSAALYYHYGWSLEQTKNWGDALSQFEQGFELIKNRKDDMFYGKLKESIQRVKQEAGIEE